MYFSHAILCSLSQCDRPIQRGTIYAVHYQKISMTLENLEAEVLSLPKDVQATLISRLLAHLGQSNEIDQEVASIWAEEAELRDCAIDNEQVSRVQYNSKQ
jgi:hypothetical protein